MKAVAFLPILLIFIAASGATIGTFLILTNQKNLVKVYINIIYNTNEPYREILSTLFLSGVYRTISISDYYEIKEDMKKFIINEIDKTLFKPKCFRIMKEEKILIENPTECKNADYNAKIPIFTPYNKNKNKVEDLYFSYIRSE